MQRTYRNDNKPVPRPGERCDSKKKITHVTTQTHPCKLTKKHDGNHVCICGKYWGPAGKKETSVSV